MNFDYERAVTEVYDRSGQNPNLKKYHKDYFIDSKRGRYRNSYCLNMIEDEVQKMVESLEEVLVYALSNKVPGNVIARILRVAEEQTPDYLHHISDYTRAVKRQVYDYLGAVWRHEYEARHQGGCGLRRD